MGRRTSHVVSALLVLLAVTTSAQQQPKPPVFRSGRVLVSVDVVVRDRQGNVVKGLKADDFEVREDGRPQDVLTFSFQEIADATEVKPVDAAPLLSGVEEKMTQAAPAASADAAPKPMTSKELADRRLIVLLFDTSSMQPEDVQRSMRRASTSLSR